MQIEMTIKGLMVDPVTSMPIVILRDKTGENVLPIWVGIFEANAIASQIENVESPRPMTHDLVKNLIDNFNGEVQKIVITDLEESTFYATIHININNKISTVDSRPSDAIAIALRAKAPIFAEKKIIDQAKNSDIKPQAGESERLEQWLQDLDEDSLGKYKM
tara:strand:+ start:116 stop:601 length:486 start_codon:yes stop_codon:yes gene_type:complete